MLPLLCSLLALALFAAAIGLGRQWYYNRKIARGEIDAPPAVRLRPEGCCGQHEICEKESLLAAVSRDIEYYDDEELDRYKGLAADAYTDEQADEFREVLYTMQTDEVAGWVRSLSLRSVELPNQLKDEVILIVGERRGL